MQKQIPMININPQIPIIGIYKITSPSGRIYIGQSINIEDRWSIYEKYSSIYKSQPKLNKSLLKYGYEQHQFEIIEECPESYLDELETWWKYYYGIQCVENGLNCSYWDKTPMRGRKQTKEAKQKISNSKKGKPSPKTTFKKGKDNKHFGKSKSKESINKVIKALTGKCKSREHIEKISLGRKKSIIQYDLEGKFIKEWDSAKDASIELKQWKSNITQCCKGKYKSACGYIWKYKLN